MIEQYIEIFKAYLKQQEIAVSEDILAIANLVFTEHEHLKLWQIQERLPEIKEPELHRTLDLLTDCGLIRKVFIGDCEEIGYEHTFGHPHHDHIYCLNCGLVIEFNDPIIEERQNIIAAEHKVKIIRHYHQIIGICESCIKDEVLAKQGEKTILPTDEKEITLSVVSEGNEVTVKRLLGDREMIDRMNSMGIIVGRRITVLQNAFAGPFIIRVNEARLAVGQAITHKIVVSRK